MGEGGRRPDGGRPAAITEYLEIIIRFNLSNAKKDVGNDKR